MADGAPSGVFTGSTQQPQQTPTPGTWSGTSWGDMSQGGGMGMQPSNYAAYKSGGYGQMPADAGGLSQALMGGAQGGRLGYGPGGAPDVVGSPGQSPLGQQMQDYANQANIAWQGQQQQFQQQMQGQQLQAAQLRNQAMQRLLGLFGGGGQGSAYNTLLNLSQTGPANIMSSPLFQQLQQAGLGQVQAAFQDPGGLQSQLQRLGASQGRYVGSSGQQEARQGVLDRNRAMAMAQTVPQALQGAIPALQSQIAAAGAALPAELTPALIAQMLGRMAG